MAAPPDEPPRRGETVETVADPDPHTPRRRRPPPTALARGQSVGRFVVLGPLGAGGMSEVYEAYDPELDRKVAVKVLRAAIEAPADEGALMLREAQATARLHHPNVVVVYDVGMTDGRMFIAMELVDGQTVRQWLAREKPSWREILAVFRAAGRGLAAAHAAGLVHRDFKPDNVMLGRDGQVRVMDFGLARAVDDAEDDAPDLSESTTALTEARRAVLDESFTRTGALLGTPGYMATEQIIGSDAIDARSDQFGFCVALYEALYGGRPFGKATGADHRMRVFTGKIEPPPPGTRVPPWLRKILLRGLRSKKDERWPSMEALLDELAKDPGIKRRRWLAAAALVALVVAVGLGARRWGATRAALCGGAEGRLRGAWDDARRQQVRAAFAATGASFAAPALTGATRLLDDFSARWAASYRDACEATQLRGEQSAEVLDLRMSCLDERLGSLRALTDVFVRADASIVQNAVTAAGALPDLGRCANVPGLRAVVPPPEDETARREVDRLRGELASFVALRDAGQCKAAQARAEALLVAVERTGYAPLRAEALAAVGFLGDHCSDVATTVPQLEAAFDAALAGRDDEQAARAAIVLPVQLDRLGRLPESRVWLGHARAVVQRLGARGGLLESWLRLAEATVAMSAGDSSAAIAAARDSVALKERLLAPDHPDRLEALATLGNALLLGGKVEEALDFDRRGVETCARIVGASHPLCALLHVNLGEALEASKRPSEARENYARALEVWRLAGADPSYVAWGLTGLGRTLVAEGRAAEAVAPLEEALEIRTATKAPPALLGETRFALAGALGTNARAVELAKAARVDLAKDARAVARIDAWLEGARSGRR